MKNTDGWHYITGVSTSENVRLYVDGALVETRQPVTEGAPTITWPLSPDNPFG